ncbi:MAG TPA: MinD/ParA family protein [Pseudonocardia sp.]|uniref:MinD/ParA family ATP-binding protein n=1 Tax=Pseudonocardia sp. TaxID=60912 RepID=UPI002B4B76D9|nr:MinD/ParA family protein [Pseudonocardia sp.]HLU58540.1 MinD/ParA family protein [Pseudonocardia sp.]
MSTDHAAPGTGGADDLTADTIVRPKVDRPRGGWRGAVFTASRGLLNPGVGPEEHAYRDQVRRIRRPLGSAHQITVTSINGGVGKTTVAACVGMVLAEHRGDRVVVLDAGQNAGTLADRLTGDTTRTVRDMLAEIDSLGSLADVSRFTSLAGRLQVLASEQDPAMDEGLDRAEYERVCEVLRRFYNVVITDSGSGLVHSAVGGTLALADSLVIVGSPTADGASRLDKTLDWLIARGPAERVADAVLVLVCDRASKHIDTARVRQHFAARCRAVVEVPFDPHLATGALIDMGRIRPATHEAFREIAAHLADRFDPTPIGVGAEIVSVPAEPL